MACVNQFEACSHCSKLPNMSRKFFKSCVPIPDWIDCGVGRFTPTHTSLQAVSSLRGPHQSEWKQNLPCKHRTLHVLCCFDDKDMSVNRYNRIATPKNRLFLLDRTMNKLILQSSNIIIKRPFSEPQLTVDTNLQEVITGVVA
jgi:hypothetical protein